MSPCRREQGQDPSLVIRPLANAIALGPYFFGVVLIAAAILKTHELADAPSGQAGAVFTNWQTMLFVIVEFFLGLWLFMGIRPIGATRVAAVTFWAFACISGHPLLRGQQSRGCFANTTFSPGIHPRLM